MQFMKEALAPRFKSSNRRRRWMQVFCCLPAAATMLLVTPSFAAVPTVVADSQQAIATGSSYPLSVAVASNGTVFVADYSNNQVYAITPNLPGNSTVATVNTSSLRYGLTAGLRFPSAVAVDTFGNLYIGDYPGGGARIVKVAANSSGVITPTSAVTTLYSGGTSNVPVSMAVSGGTLYIGDLILGVLSTSGAIYTLPTSGGTPTQLPISGVVSTYDPTAMAVYNNKLFFVDNNSNNGGVYVAPLTGGAAKPVLMGSFSTKQPSGLAVDNAGDLFVLALLHVGPTGSQVLEIPGASSTTNSAPFIIPSTDLEGNGGTASGLALDPEGNVDVIGYEFAFESYTGVVTQLNYLNPVNLGSAGVFATGSAILFNFELNAPTKFTGLRAVTLGDLQTASDVTAEPSTRQATFGTCVAANYTTSTVVSPYTCYQDFQATPQYVGTRVSAIQVEGTSTTNILGSTPVYENGTAAAQITYPLDTNLTQLGLVQPQGVAVSGFNQTVYVADLQGGKIYAVSTLNGNKTTTVSTGSVTLIGPSAVAMNGEGDLYVADFGSDSVTGKIAVVPTTTGIAPYTLNTGGLVKHPISLALDELGDVFIGDAGAQGDNASSTSPGYVVVIPYAGSPFKLSLSGVNIIFPQALAVNNANGTLAIGDGGDVSTFMGQVVEVSTAGGAAHKVSYNNSAPSPSGLVFDAASNLYILDGVASTLTEVRTNGSIGPLSFVNPTTALSSPSALAASAGTQSFVIANLGGGTANNLVFLNGNSSTIAFGDQKVNTTSASKGVTVANIGNMSLDLMHYTAPVGFDAGDMTCTSGDISPLDSCTIAWKFAPTKTGAYGGFSILTSNAYNSNGTGTNLSGTGVPKTNVQSNMQKPVANKALAGEESNKDLRQTKRFGRKSFASTRQK